MESRKQNQKSETKNMKTATEEKFPEFSVFFLSSILWAQIFLSLSQKDGRSRKEPF